MPSLDGIDLLTGRNVSIDAKLNFLYQVIPEYTREGYSGAQTLSDLRSYDFKIGSDLFYLARRQTLGIQNEFETIRYFPLSYTPSDIDLGVTDYPIGANYKIIYRIRHENEITGDRRYSYFGVETNSLGTIRDIEEMGIDYYDSFYPNNEGEETTLEIWKGMRRGE